jgi:hypothetical protein
MTKYIPYPYDLILFILIGYFLAYIFSSLIPRGIISSKIAKNQIKQEDSNKLVSIEREFKELTQLIHKTLSVIPNTSTGQVNFDDSKLYSKINHAEGKLHKISQDFQKSKNYFLFI